METKWINAKRKPRMGAEYNVVWNLQDNGYPTVTTMDYDATIDEWTDPRSDNRKCNDIVLFWAHLPKPPKGISKSIWYVD